MTLDQLLEESHRLPPVSHADALWYQSHQQILAEVVNRQLSARDDIHELIGYNSLEIMYDNHKHHAAFMATVFVLNDYRLLVKTLPWVYRAYHQHGFSYDYFPVELNAWLQALEEYAAELRSGVLPAVYRWMISIHEQLIPLSRNEQNQPPLKEEWLEDRNAFLAGLLEGRQEKVDAIARKYVNNAADLEGFYLYILQPSMFDIGTLWEKAEISIAQEHLASAIVNRVMSRTIPALPASGPMIGRAVVAASPNEFHELGAWMIADVLDFDGWQVKFIGANIPQDELIDFLHSDPPDLLALSVTIPFNLAKARRVVELIRADSTLGRLKVMVGGQAFAEQPDLWQKIGADGFAGNAVDARILARKWVADGC